MKNLDLSSILQIITPDNPAPVVFDSPHSGTLYPDDFGYGCDMHLLRQLEDAHVDRLFDQAPNHGGVLLRALFPRSYIDVNRARDDIDPTLCDIPWPHSVHGSINPTSRSDSGIGLVPRQIKTDTPIYNRVLTPHEIMNRVKNYYDPYHDTLCAALNRAYDRHGSVFHINCHSMPNSSSYPKQRRSMFEKPSDIVLGDRNGRTSGRSFIYMLRDFWTDLGYNVTLNDPFQGVELIHAYAQPTQRRHSVQIEINRQLYMNEEDGTIHNGFEKIKKDCTDMVMACTHFVQDYGQRITLD